MKTIYGGGGVEGHARCGVSREHGNSDRVNAIAYRRPYLQKSERMAAGEPDGSGKPNAATANSRNQALPASTLSPARCLTALPSRQVAGSYNDDELREGFAMKYLGA